MSNVASRLTTQEIVEELQRLASLLQQRNTTKRRNQIMAKFNELELIATQRLNEQEQQKRARAQARHTVAPLPRTRAEIYEAANREREGLIWEQRQAYMRQSAKYAQDWRSANPDQAYGLGSRPQTRKERSYAEQWKAANHMG